MSRKRRATGSSSITWIEIRYQRMQQIAIFIVMVFLLHEYASIVQAVELLNLEAVTTLKNYRFSHKKVLTCSCCNFVR